MAATFACNKSGIAARVAASASPAKVGKVAPRTVQTRAAPLELLAAAGDVDAPIAVPLVAGLVVTAAVTFAVPAYLARGQQAADKIFASKQKAPLDKKTTKGKTTAGKTAAGKKTTRR